MQRAAPLTLPCLAEGAAITTRVIARQLWRFTTIGVIGFCVDAGMLIIALRVLLLNLYAARAVSFLVAVTASWVLNRNYTFRGAGSAARATEWLRFALCNSLGGAVNLGIYVLLVRESSLVHAYPVLGVACGSLGGLLVNFVLTRTFVFHANRLSLQRP
jgi:putative flippase GtrA